MAAWVRVDRYRGLPAVVLSSDRVEATFLPSLGMLGASLTLDGEEYLSFQGGARAFAAGHTTALPLLHPWANRLGAPTYKAAGVDVSLVGVRGLHRDSHGLPLHGTMVGPRQWDLLELSATSKRARLVAAFDYGAEEELLAVFPFPHVVEIEVNLRGQQLRIRTTVRPTGKQRVPISFGWHPYFRLPGSRRSTWALQLPKRKHVLLNTKALPTGETAPEKAENAPIGRRAIDDSYQLGGTGPWTLGLASDDRRVRLELDEGYPYVQVYVPPRKLFAAIEPMTAPINALVDRHAPKVKPGMEYYATFSIELSATQPKAATVAAVEAPPTA